MAAGAADDLTARLAALQQRIADLTDDLKAARAERNALVEQRSDAYYRQARRAVVAAGLGEYLLVPGDSGERPFVPGYARRSEFLPWRRDFVTDLRQRDWVQVTDRVLDVGCGIGGVAVFLVDVLDPGSYVGLDVVPRAIEECRRNIGARHPNFSFEVIDVWSDGYNPKGSSPPGEYRFPFGDDSFDLAILRSVFTHMPPAAAEHYLTELARLLAPGGRTAITHFLLDEQAEAAVVAGAAAYRFAHLRGGYRLESVESPEAAVAVEEYRVLAGYDTAGLEVVEIQRGNWRSDSPAHPFQDVVYARKR